MRVGISCAGVFMLVSISVRSVAGEYDVPIAQVGLGAPGTWPEVVG